MTSQIIDSDRRCPHCSKRMMLEIGQNDGPDTASGWVQMIHHCWSCGYVERDDQWRRPSLISGPTAAERLRAQRLEGWEMPYRTDIPAVEPSEWEDVDAVA